MSGVEVILQEAGWDVHEQRHEIRDSSDEGGFEQSKVELVNIDGDKGDLDQKEDFEKHVRYIDCPERFVHSHYPCFQHEKSRF